MENKVEVEEIIKRAGGKLIDGKWLVLTESEGKEGVGFVHKCGIEILAVSRAHPIWDGPFPCSGSGQCHYEQVPYCSKCEEKPSSSGAPITR